MDNHLVSTCQKIFSKILLSVAEIVHLAVDIPSFMCYNRSINTNICLYF